MEASNAAEHLNENLLRNVGGVRRVLQAARNQRIKGLMVPVDQLGKPLLGARLELGHEGGIFVRNANRARQLVHCNARLHLRVPIPYDFGQSVGKPFRNASYTALRTAARQSCTSAMSEGNCAAGGRVLAHSNSFRHRQEGFWFPFARRNPSRRGNPPGLRPPTANRMTLQWFDESGVSPENGTSPS